MAGRQYRRGASATWTVKLLLLRRVGLAGADEYGNLFKIVRGVSVRVNWETAKPHYEDMVSTLLSILHPESERIDGAGGDGGRDVQIRGPQSLDIFELKSFTGRLSSRAPNRRSQVEKSLNQAASLQPNAWSLVVPIDPNPAELTWFDSLKASRAFPLFWLGKTWLDGKMAEHPELPRYFLTDVDNEVVSILREINAEQAALTRGVPDALERFENLSQRLNEISPHYSFRLSNDGEGYSVSLWPRYRDALRDRPLLVNTSFKFPPTDAGNEARSQLESFMNYGGEVEIGDAYVTEIQADLPAGMGGTFKGGTLRLSSNPSVGRLPFGGRLEISDPQGRRLSSLPVIFSRRDLGGRGGTLYGCDLTGGLKVRILFDIVETTGKLTFDFSIPKDVLPAAILPFLRFARNVVAPNSILVKLENQSMGALTDLPGDPVVEQGFVDLVTDLDLIQTRTATPFALPDVFGRSDLEAIQKCSQLLQGGEVPVGTGLAGDIVLAEDTSLARILEEQDGTAIAFPVSDLTESIAGVRVPLGSAIISSRGVRVANREALQLLSAEGVRAGSKVRIELQAVESETINLRLGQLPEAAE